MEDLEFEHYLKTNKRCNNIADLYKMIEELKRLGKEFAYALADAEHADSQETSSKFEAYRTGVNKIAKASLKFV